MKAKIINISCYDVWYYKMLYEIIEVEEDDTLDSHYKVIGGKYNKFIRKENCEIV